MNYLQPEPDIVVFIRSFFILNSYTYAYARYYINLQFCTTLLNKSRELQGTIYVNTQML
jgi:hypothetical protein